MLQIKDYRFRNEVKGTQLIDMMKLKWDQLHEETNVFRYSLDNLQERKVDMYLLQLNLDRNVKRRTPECIDSICQPFDENKFNFTKASPNELIFNLIREGNESDIHSLIVNVSPISRYHSLLCPSINKHLPQVVTPESLQLVLEIMCSVQDRELRIGFNSLCAMASVNHLHYHLCIERHVLPVEVAICKQIKGPLYCLENYPIPAFCFEVQENAIDATVSDIYRLLEYCLVKSIAYNVLVTRGHSVERGQQGKDKIRVLVWPRKSSSGVKQLAVFNVAVLELSGWFTVYTKEDFENLRIGDLEGELKKWSLNNFESICEDLKSLY